MIAVAIEPVRDIDGLLVGCGDLGREEHDLLHGTRLSLGRDVIAYAVGLEQQDHHATGEILQCAAQGHTDSQTGRSEQRDDRSGVDTHDLNDQENQHDVGDGLDQVAQEDLQRTIHLALFESRRKQFYEAADKPTPRHVYRQGEDDFQADPDTFRNQIRQDFFQIHISDFFDRFREFGFCMLSGTMSFSVCCAVMKRNPMKELNLIG